MKRFLLKLLFFFIITSSLIYISGDLLYYCISKYGRNFLNNADYKVTESILRSRKHKKVKKLILGDSVASSLYGECEDSCVYSLCATVAITPVGHYLLCANFMANNENQLPEEVILILNPLCWTNTMSGGLFYSTFTKNFFNSEFKKYLAKEDIAYLNGETYAALCDKHWYQLSPYIPETYKTQESGKYIAPIQYKYVMMMKCLCDKKGVSFKLYSGPVRESLKAEIERKRQGDTMCETPLFDTYFSSIQYWDDDCFTDQLHLKKDCVPHDYFHLYE